jgi:hypothetical protein
LEKFWALVKTKRSQLLIRTHNETLFHRRDVRQQPRLFVCENPRLKRSPNSIGLC